MHRFNVLYIALIIALYSLSSCSTYKQHYMFRTGEEGETAKLKGAVTTIQKNYLIQPNDRLEMRVYTHNGEMLVDPEYELQQGQNNNRNNFQLRREFDVLQDSTIKLPLIGHINLSGLTIDEAEKLLEEKYKEFYVEPFVMLEYLNKRVIVLGAPGGMVIPLENENMNLIEVLALAGGIDESAKANNIRLIRGDLNEPEVYQIDLSSIYSMKSGMMQVKSGDIIYIEPKVRIFNESLRDFGLVIGAVANVLTLTLVFSKL